MKVVYILIVLLVAASALGCVDKKSPESTASTDSGQQDAVSSGTSEQTDEFGIESDLETLDSMFNDTEMDISFEVSADAFT
ncbi:MAG: hypothetical protein OIN89_02245 [Candidatus Methanoperedens sp.]|jgi:hypothetical protein|nr:hypothetical protein [Candidatus Methanoperedens sp.]PKL54349.1 MAG: hypothetical protein CVV36_02205 [Candidatus Methanoperedenaceae archaeon HGW-Methanoperedenaceae-1]